MFTSLFYNRSCYPDALYSKLTKGRRPTASRNPPDNAPDPTKNCPCETAVPVWARFWKSGLEQRKLTKTSQFYRRSCSRDAFYRRVTKVPRRISAACQQKVAVHEPCGPRTRAHPWTPKPKREPSSGGAFGKNWENKKVLT